jgi:hypothetical protein
MRNEKMERRGSKHLRIAATLELLLGAALIAGTFLGIGADTEFGGLVGLDPSKVLFGVSGMYAVNAFKVLTGLLGIALANKKSFLTVACGFICFIMQLSAFFQSGNGGLEIAVNVVLLVIPYYYLHNAWLNFKDKK